MRLLFLLILTSCLPAKTIRVATYNVSLAQTGQGQLAALLRTGTHVPAKKIAEVIQIVQPDVLLLNEFDYDANGTAATRMNDKFFNVSQNGRPAQDYPYRYVAISNTGVHSGFDFDNNGTIDDSPGDISYGGDALGFGEFPGKYAMAVFSKFPIDTDAIRTFEEFLWKDMPDNLIPRGFYLAEEQEVFRLSSKSHWDVPIQVHGTTFHFLVSHPTPPVFDGSEDRNGRRNHDEIRLWADYLSPGAAGYLRGGLSEGNRFVIAGDQNADPTRGDSVNAAINQLLDHPRVDASFVPERTGARTASNKFDTSTFRLRVDYVLPSQEGFHILDGAVFWPTGGQDGATLVTGSDHRPVYLDLKLIPLIDEAVCDVSVTSADGNSIISWKIKDEVSYRLEKSIDLDTDFWMVLDDLSVDIQGDKAAVIIPAPNETEFYRIVSYYE
ncbi:MAG: endonuclease/exonuclease/phosphatase family metal-dependent hydrolase [Akkermansiaceae bacterium]|mgnify:CR=1 FL=1